VITKIVEAGAQVVKVVVSLGNNVTGVVQFSHLAETVSKNTLKHIKGIFIKSLFKLILFHRKQAS
jgi:hypothetical protein